MRRSRLRVLDWRRVFMTVRYPIMPKEESREMRRAIRRVFVEFWDPIGVMSDPEWPRDEYDGYIGRVFELLTTGGSDKEDCRISGIGSSADGDGRKQELVCKR